ncbi:MAG: hypothetical protein IPJ74_06645 [Saprospiraceae bacterium]|nr:hypothetical protein [Saprospiraceae bacterium]
MEGQSCISNDGKEYTHGSLNAAKTHRCRNGTWDKVASMAPAFGTTETGLTQPEPFVVTVKEVITVIEKVIPTGKDKKK